MPLFLCLASSLNVELVYIILKGVQQFSNVQNKTADERAQMGIHSTKDGVVAQLDYIEIRDFNKWSEMTTEEIKDIQKDNTFEPNKVKSAMKTTLLKKFEQKRSEMDIQRIPTKASIKFHQMDIFTKMFKEMFTE